MHYDFSFRKSSSSLQNNVDYKISSAPPHHPAIRPILTVTLARAVTLQAILPSDFPIVMLCV